MFSLLFHVLCSFEPHFRLIFFYLLWRSFKYFNASNPSGNYMYHQNYFSKNSALYPYNYFMCFVQFSVQTAIISFILTLVIPLCFSDSYKMQIPVKHNNFIIQLYLRQRVSTVLGHCQTF